MSVWIGVCSRLCPISYNSSMEISPSIEWSNNGTTSASDVDGTTLLMVFEVYNMLSFWTWGNFLGILYKVNHPQPSFLLHTLRGMMNHSVFPGVHHWIWAYEWLQGMWHINIEIYWILLYIDIDERFCAFEQKNEKSTYKYLKYEIVKCPPFFNNWAHNIC